MTLEKNLTARPLYVRKKKILSPAGLGEKILSPSNHPYTTHSPSMSNGRLFLLFLCCSAPLFLVFLMFPCSCAPPVSYPASIACERQTFLLAHPRWGTFSAAMNEEKRLPFAQATASRVTSISPPPPPPPPPPRSRTIEGDAVRRVAVSLLLLFLCSCAPTVPLFLHSSLAQRLRHFAPIFHGLIIQDGRYIGLLPFWWLIPGFCHWCVE